jgi:hypothetical protein
MLAAMRFMVTDPVTIERSCSVAKAPARGGGRALRGGACRALIPRKGTGLRRPLQANLRPTRIHGRHDTGINQQDPSSQDIAMASAYRDLSKKSQSKLNR